MIFEFSKKNIDIGYYCKDHDINFALIVKNRVDIILSNTIGASFIIVNEALSVDAQKFAEEYMFDSKILMKAYSKNDIETAAQNGIDGVIFKDGILFV